MLEIQLFYKKILQTADSEWLLVNEKVMLMVGLDKNQ